MTNERMCWLCKGPIGAAPASESPLGPECDQCRDAYAQAWDSQLIALGTPTWERSHAPYSAPRSMCPADPDGDL